MSGPKRSTYSYRQSVYDAIQAQRQLERQRLLDKIRNHIKLSEELLKRCTDEYGEFAEFLNRRVRDWISRTEQDCKGDLMLAWIGVNGIGSYIQSQIPVLEKRRAEHKRALENERIKFEKQQEMERKRFMVNQKMKYFDDLSELYPQMLNPGIVQRIEMFRNALSVNPENSDTLDKINEFKTQFGKMVENYEFEQDQKNFLKKTLSEIIGADEGGDDGNSLAGNFEGVPITINLDSKDQQLSFDLPDDGSCKPNLSRLISRFDSAGIKLGPVQIVRTGEVLQHNQSDIHDNHKTRA